MQNSSSAPVIKTQICKIFLNLPRLERVPEIESTHSPLRNNSTEIQIDQTNSNQAGRESLYITEERIQPSIAECHCNLCKKTFCNKYVCRKHKATQHGDWESTSIEPRDRRCSKKITSSTSVESRPLLSGKQKIIANLGFCHICKKDFYNKAFLRAHEFDKHGIGFVSNPLTDRINQYSRQYYRNKKTPSLVIGSGQVMAHPDSNQGISCHLCPSFFPSACMLQMHRTNFHKEIPALEEFGSSSQYYVAPAQQQIPQSSSGGNADSIRHQEVQQNKGGLHICYVCQHPFGTRQSCIDHMFKCHPPANRRSSSNSNFSPRAEIQTPIRSFTCPSCGYSPTHRPHLLPIHLKTMSCIPDLIPIYPGLSCERNTGK